MHIVLLAGLLGAAAVDQLPDPAAINLVCVGAGQEPSNEWTSRLEWDKYDHRYRVREGLESSTRSFDTAVTIQLAAGDGRIRLPKKLLPPINSGGDDQHWWQLVNLVVTPDQITASYRLNGLNHPKVRIDRTTGMISIKGFEQDFTGRCDKIDPGVRRF
jgi:hypothetical protein